MTLRVVIAKPTKSCNADCDYCGALPDGKPGWSTDDFKRAIDKLLPVLPIEGVEWIWHGGEPMLQGPDFYYKCDEYSQNIGIPILLQ